VRYFGGEAPRSPRLGITSLMKPRLPHCIEAELISALGTGTNLDVAAADQSRPSATRTTRPIHPMRCIFIPHLGKIGLAYFSPSECEVAHPSRGINGGSNQRARMGGRGGERFRGVLWEGSMVRDRWAQQLLTWTWHGNELRAEISRCRYFVRGERHEVLAWAEVRDVSGGRRVDIGSFPTVSAAKAACDLHAAARCRRDRKSAGLWTCGLRSSQRPAALGMAPSPRGRDPTECDRHHEMSDLGAVGARFTVAARALRQPASSQLAEAQSGSSARAWLITLVTGGAGL
jgi:hypothetical protein